MLLGDILMSFSSCHMFIFTGVLICSPNLFKNIMVFLLTKKLKTNIHFIAELNIQDHCMTI